jgi:DNA modification methylase
MTKKYIITNKKLINDNNIYYINKYNMSNISNSNKTTDKKNKSIKNKSIKNDIDDELEKLENELNLLTNDKEKRNIITKKVNRSRKINDNESEKNDSEIESDNEIENDKTQKGGKIFDIGLKINDFHIDDNINLLKKIKDESINLIYFDPPYNTGRNFFDFDDKFKSKEDFINFIKLRILECHRILKKDGTMIIHIEPKISHYFRIMCDDIFGDKNFKNEIVWQTGGNAKNKYQLNRFHDTIIVYSKSNKQVFNPLYFEYDEEYKKKSNVKMCEFKKKEYVTTAIYNAQPDVNPRPNLRYTWKGHLKQWYVTKEKMEELDKDNRLQYNKDNVPRIKRYLDEMDGVPLRDVWIDINNTQNGEKLDYATQKPIKLLERIIKLYSNENDLCLDIFAGSGTLGRACITLKRNYLLFDVNKNGKKIFEDSIKN